MKLADAAKTMLVAASYGTQKEERAGASVLVDQSHLLFGRKVFAPVALELLRMRVVSAPAENASSTEGVGDISSVLGGAVAEQLMHLEALLGQSPKMPSS